MKKSDVVLREILCSYMDGVNRFTQLYLSKKLGFSLSTVNASIKRLEEIGAVALKKRGFYMTDFYKALVFFATKRDLKRDVVYSTRINMSVRDIEKNLPDGVAFTAYTAYNLLFNEAPADYSEVYVYADAEALGEIKIRFKQEKGPPNLIVLKPDVKLLLDIKGKKLKRSCVCPAQLFSDLWNINTWYAKEYVKAFERMIEQYGILEQ